MELNDIIKSFKRIDKKIESNGTVIIKYQSDIFKDYFVVSIDDNFHPTEYELFRNETKIYTQSNEISLQLIAEVIKREVEKKEPYYVLRKEGEKYLIYDVFDKKLEEESNLAKKVKERGYYEKCERVDDDNFKTVYFNVDKNGNPTTKFTEEDWKNLIEKNKKESEELNKKLDANWSRWRKKYNKSNN